MTNYLQMSCCEFQLAPKARKKKVKEEWHEIIETNFRQLHFFP